MQDAKLNALAIIKAATAVTNLVPATRITVSWPTTTSTFPCITADTIDQYDDTYMDDAPESEMAQVQVHIFGKANTNCFPIADAINTAMVSAGWARYFMYDFTDPDMSIPHWVMRFQTRYFY